MGTSTSTSKPKPKSSSPKRVLWVIIGVIILVLIVAGLLFLPFSPFYIGGKTAEDPQYQAFLDLEQASREPIDVSFQNGFPRFVSARVPVAGENSVERARTFLTTYQSLYLQDDPDFALGVLRTEGENDESVFFYQTYRGIPVFAGEMVVVVYGEEVTSTLGGLLTQTVDTEPAITAQQAEQIALAQFNLPSEAILAADTRLEIYDQSIYDDVLPEPHLVWRVFLADVPRHVLVDAHTGQVVFVLSLSDADLYLYEQDANYSKGDNTGCYYLTTNDDVIFDGHWGTSNWVADYNSDREAISVYHGSKRVYDYYYNTFGLVSFDGRDQDVEVYVHANVPNAQWTGGWGCELIEFKDGWVSLDILAHEFTHGVGDHTADFVYANQPGALDESYADVMASQVDGDWIQGSRKVLGGGPDRDLSNPPAHHQPDHFSDYRTSPNTEDGDWGGVHTNSGIPNKAAYLIAAGGTHRGWTIRGIGTAKMARLYYSVLRFRLSRNSQFLDARNASVRLALDWAGGCTPGSTRPGTYGFTPQDVCQVRNAFASVELGDGDVDCDCTEDRDPDRDRDGIPDSRDYCVMVFNPDQADMDHDGSGDLCDDDNDNDRIPDSRDNCRFIANTDQGDQDGNHVGDACQDTDRDGVLDVDDNCDFLTNPLQADTDNDGDGNACDKDMDGDGRDNENDNCSLIENPDQADRDDDGVGDACDNCGKSNPDQADMDHDGIGDLCDDDMDGDGIKNEDDNCSRRANRDQADLDENGIGSACDAELLRLTPVNTRVVLNPNPTRVVRLPIPQPRCLTCEPDWFPQSTCFQMTITNLDRRVAAFISNDVGRSVAHWVNDGQTLPLRYRPMGGLGYFINFIFSSEVNDNESFPFNILLDQVECPGVAVPQGTVMLPSAGAVSLTASGAPAQAYYGQCGSDQPTMVNFEVTAYGNTASIASAVVWYTYFDAEANPIMGDKITLTLGAGGTYTGTLDLNQYAGLALGGRSGRIQFLAHALDSAGNILSQSEIGEVVVYPCAPIGGVVVQPRPIPTNTPTAIPQCTDQDQDGYCVPSDCEDDNAEINPGVPEEDNSIDDNCNGMVDEGFDLDGDGYTPSSGDCDETDAKINPMGTENPKDGIDSNCNGFDDY